MKPPFLLCFLVLVTLPASRGETPTVPPAGEDHKEILSVDRELNKTTVPPNNEDHNGHKNESETPKPVTTQQLLNGSRNDTTSPTAPTPSKPTSQKASSVSMTQGGKEKKSGSKDNEEVTSLAPMSTSAAPAPPSSSKAGYVILVFIIIVIIILCVILYMLRRASRSYSFDLQRPAPSSRLDEPIGTFEQVYLDDLDRPVPKDMVLTEDLSTTPVANGTSPALKEKETSEEKSNEESQEQPEANGVQNSPSISSSTSSSDDQPEEVSNQLSSNNNLFFDAAEEKQQNENNNNPSVSYTHPFVEVNLDEPEWRDQFLTSPQPTSSVYPFSSFSSSS